MDISQLPTPSLVVYLDKVKRNINTMAERCKSYGVRLRPHFKTSKALEVAELQTNGTKRGIVVSTLAEASFLAENGFDDILYAAPLGNDAHKMRRCVELTKKLKEFHVMVDRIEMVEKLSNITIENGHKWSVFIGVDCGYHRDGILHSSNEVMELAKKLQECDKVELQGLYTHCGQSYKVANPSLVQNVADDIVNALLALVERLKSCGVECKHYGLGSTPTCSRPTESMRKLTEWHPGNYVFYDLQQEMLGSCKRDDIACVVVTRIIGHYSNDGVDHMLVDCGWTALTTQGKGKVAPGGFGTIVDQPNIMLSTMTQEVGKVTTVDGQPLPFARYPVGSMLSILPYHSCATCCMHPIYYVSNEDGKIIDEWRPVKGW